MAQSLTKSSASLVAAGGNLAEAAALTATANAIIQDADSVGTALKTTSLRLRGTSVKVLEEEGLDTDGAVESTSKLRSQVLATSGVDILTDTGAYKSTYQILLEIAEVWDQITDDKARAGLLELLAGKRNSSVIAALLQNPEDLKAAYEDAMDAEGSALKENERYLDSIQGKIDQFNNAMQAMWSNTLDSDAVKGFVALGTEIIKIIDKIGLLNTALIALATYSMIKNKMGPIAFLGGISDLIRDVVGKVGGFIGSLAGMTAATSAYTAETLAASVANGTLSATEAANIATKNGLTLATTKLNAAEALALLTKGGMQKADALAIVSKLGLSTATKKLTVDTLTSKMATAGYTKEQIAAATAALFGAGANKTLAASFGALWTAIWPILAVMASVAVIWGTVKLIDHLVVTTEELTEELNELKTELQDIQSELDSVNSELETTESRMAELLAKDSLTFTEEEELDRLQKENAELQRKLDLLEQEEQFKQEETARKFNETMSSANSDDYYVTGEKKKWWNRIVDGMAKAIAPGSAGETTSLDGVLNSKIRAYENYAIKLAEVETKMANVTDKDEYDKLSKEKTRIDKEMRELQTYVGNKTKEMNANAEGLEYFTGDDLEDWQIEANKNLDKIRNFQDKWAIVQGGTNAKSNAITRIFNKDEYSEASDTIDNLVEQLAKDPTDQTVLNQISEQCKLAEKDLLAIGLSVEDAKNHFTQLGEEANFSTLEGKIKEVGRAATNFEKLLQGNAFKVDGIDTGLADLFDEEGKIIQAKLSQVFQGTSEQTRAEITRLLEGSYDMIADGLDDAEIGYLMNRMGLSFSRAILEVEQTSLATKNLELFPGLEDEISGIIDTFSELTSAVGSVVDAMDTLDKARAEEAYSGSMSLETLEALMKSTDNYADLIEVDETGAIKLATNAQEILVAQKLEAIKQNAALALEEAELAYQEALHTEQTYSQTGPAQEFMRGLWNEVGGAMAFVGSLWNDLTSGNWSGAWDRAKQARDSSITTKETEYSTKAAEASAAVAEAAKNVENAEKMNKIAQGLTPENVKQRYSSEEASGGADDKKEVEDNAFQKEMDYWENLIQANQAKYTQIQNEIDLLEAQGKRAGADYYKEQIKFEKERLDLLKQQQEQARLRLQSLESEKGSEAWWEAAHIFNDLEDEIDGAILSIQELNNAIIDGSHGFVDDIQDVYDTLTEAQKEYTENGYLSVDTMQSLLELEPKYLDLLVDENGNLNLNKQALQDVARARIEDLSIKQQQAIIDRALQLATDGSRQAIIQQIAVMETAATVGEHWLTIQMRAIAAAIRAKVAMGELTQAEGDAFISGTASQLRAVQSVAKSSLNNLNKALAGEDEDESFQKTMDYWDNRIKANQAKYEQLQNEIDLLESQGRRAGEEYYNKQIELENERMWLLEQQRVAASDQLDTLEEGSDEWWDLAHTLNDIESELDDVTASIVSLQDAIGDIDTYKFEEFNSRLDDTTSKLETIRGLIAPDGAEDWFDDQGQWTEDGVAVLGSYIQELEIYRNGLKNTRSELEKYKDAYNSTTKAYYANLGIHSEQEYYDKVQELTEQQYDYTQSISDAERSVVDMYESNIDAVEKYTQTLVDSYNDYIDSVKEALDAERD